MLKTLRERRAKAVEDARAIYAAADAAKRQPTADETRKFDEFIAEADQLKAEIERRERLDAEERELSTSQGRKAAPVDPGGHYSAASEVRMLAPTDRLFDAQRDALPSELRGLTFGGYVRAMIAGARTEAERRALGEGTDSAGGYTVPDVLSRQLIDRLRAQAAVVRAGAVTVPLTSDVTKIARIASDPAAAWRLENAAIAESDPTFEAVTFTARSLAVLVKVSRELLEDSVNIEEALTMAFAGSMAGELDRVALAGSGTPPEPRGIRNTTNVNSASMGTNGAALTNYDKLIDAIYESLLDNAQEPTAAIMHPRTATAFARLKDTTNQPMRRPDMLEKLPFLSTTAISITDTQGTANNASRIYTGLFPDLFVGVRTGLRVEVLRERYAEAHQYAFVAHLRADVQLAHPESFSQLIGIIP